jgi:hypothetical protein
MFAVGLMLQIGSCSPPQELRRVEAATRDLQEHILGGSAEAYYDSATSRFKARMSKSDFEWLCRRMSARLGSCGPVRIVREAFVQNSSGRFVTITCHRSCASAELDDVIGWQVTSSAVRLDSYDPRTGF